MLWIANARDGVQPAPQPIKGGEGSEAAAGGGGRADVHAGEGTAASGSLSGKLLCLTLDAGMQREELEKLRSYDPSLMLLLEWMTEPDPAHRADMMDVLRHP
jgi:hypothetical protein